MVENLAPHLLSDPDWGEYWDMCLENTLRKDQGVAEAERTWKTSMGGGGYSWSKEDYNEDEHNCFAFVLNFLKSLKQNPFSSEANNKLDFCRKFILPKTTLAGKYICLYRKIKKCGDGDIRDVFVPNYSETGSKDIDNIDFSIEDKIAWVSSTSSSPNH